MPDPRRESTKEKNEPVPAPLAKPVDLVNSLSPETAPLFEKEKEKILEEAINMEATPSANPAIVSSPPAPVFSPAEIKEAAQKITALEKNQQLKSLIDLAFDKGVNYATEVARNLDNPYLLDEFHDTLVDKFYKELVEKGKLEEV